MERSPWPKLKNSTDLTPTMKLITTTRVELTGTVSAELELNNLPSISRLRRRNTLKMLLLEVPSTPTTTLMSLPRLPTTVCISSSLLVSSTTPTLKANPRLSNLSVSRSSLPLRIWLTVRPTLLRLSSLTSRLTSQEDQKLN